MRQEKNAIIVGFTYTDTIKLRKSLRVLGFVNASCYSRLSDFQLKTVGQLSSSFLFVNLDRFNGLAEATDALSNLRKRRLDIVVIAVSEMVRHDDLGLDRKRICDATLRLPFSDSRLNAAIAAAESNNLQLNSMPGALPARLIRTCSLR